MLGAVLPFMTRMMATGVYDVTNVGFESASVITNTTPMRPFRGAGRPEAAAAIERAVDLFAAEIGMDPAEVRRKNLLADDVYPYSHPGRGGLRHRRLQHGAGPALEAADYDDLRAEQARRREAGDTRQLGIGLAVYVEITALGGGGEFGTVTALADGTVEVRTGATPVRPGPRHDLGDAGFGPARRADGGGPGHPRRHRRRGRRAASPAAPARCRSPAPRSCRPRPT